MGVVIGGGRGEGGRRCGGTKMLHVGKEASKLLDLAGKRINLRRGVLAVQGTNAYLSILHCQ